MADSPPRLDWQGVTLDCVIVICITVLTALRLCSLFVFLAVTGPLVGARLAAAKAGAASGAASTTGSTALALALGFWSAIRPAGAS